MQYYRLELDAYDQPRGFVIEITEEQYKDAVAANVPYLYTNYFQALERAQD